MQKNVASQKIGAQMVSATDGSAFTGSVTVYVTGDAGTQAAGSVGSGACTHEGNGYHTYAPAQAETNYDLIAFTFIGTGAIPQTIQVETRVDTNITHFGGTAGTFSGGRPEVNTTHWKGTTAAAVDTAGYPVVTLKNGTGAGELAINTGRVAVDSIAAGAIDASVIADGAIDAATFAAGAITAAAIAADAIGASELAADAVAEIADAVWDESQSGHTTAGTFGQVAYIIRANTAQAGAGTTITLDASASAVDDFYNSALVVITAGTGAGQSRQITDYVGATKVATVATWAANPDATSVFVILPFAVGSGLDAAGVRSAVGLASANLDTQLSTIDDFLDTEIAAIKAKTDNLPSDPADASDIAALIAGVSNPASIQSTTIATLASQTQFTLTAGSADDKAYEGCLAVVTDASTSTQKAVAPVLSYTGSTKTVRLAYDPGVFTMDTTDTITIIAASERPTVHVELSVKSTAGTTAQLAVWVEVAGRIVPVATIDASASCSVVVREHDHGANLFTASGSAADITNSVFEYEQASPGFTDDRQYTLTASVTMNGFTYSTTHNRVVIG